MMVKPQRGFPAFYFAAVLRLVSPGPPSLISALRAGAVPVAPVGPQGRSGRSLRHPDGRLAALVPCGLPGRQNDGEPQS